MCSADLFTEAHTVRVDVKQYSEEEEPGITDGPMPDGFFDESGRSLLATLDQRKPSEFDEGEEVTFDWETAESLINDGKAERVENLYDRRLIDYARDFRAIDNAINGLDRQIQIAETDLKKLDESLRQLGDQLTFETQQRDDLQHDADGLAREAKVLGPYVAAIEKKWTTLRAELSRLYRANRQLANN